MKVNLLKFVIMLMFYSTYAQQNQRTELPYVSPQMLDISKFSNRNQQVITSPEPYVFNLKFHGVHLTDGTDIGNINENLFMTMVGRLNEVFNQYNIFFKYRGFNIINNSNLIDNTLYPSTVYDYPIALKNQFVINNLYDEKSINIFLYYSPFDWIYGLTSPGMTDLIFNAGGTTPTEDMEYRLPRIMGQNFGLLNIEYGQFAGEMTLYTNLPNCISTVPDPYFRSLLKPLFNTISTAENVERSGLNYNADIAGDLVADTQACFYGFQQNYCRNTATFPYSDFTIFSNDNRVVDKNLVPYQCTAVEGSNFMVYQTSSLSPTLMHTFTNGQAQRMKEYITGNLTNMFGQKLNLLEDNSSDISVLYEPFVSNGSSGNNNNMTASSRTFSTNSTNTGANIWNCGPFAMRFQTGFDCEFSSPTGVVNQSIYQQYNTSTSTYVGVKIPILGQQIYTNNAPVCFNSFEPFTSGDVKSLNSLGLGVYTQEQLDEIKASDPKLYEQLQSGKYHIITKQTDSGFIDQKVIFKN